MTGQAPELDPLPHRPAAAWMPPEDPTALALLQQLDADLKDPNKGVQAFERFREDVKALVFQDNLRWAQEQQNLAGMQNRDRERQQQLQAQEDQQRAQDLVLEMRTNGSRSPDLRKVFEEQIVSLEGRVPPEMVDSLRQTHKRISDFAGLSPALASEMGQAAKSAWDWEHSPSIDNPATEAARGALSGVGIGTMGPMQSRVLAAMQKRAAELETAVYGSPREVAGVPNFHPGAGGVPGPMPTPTLVNPKGIPLRGKGALTHVQMPEGDVNVPEGYQWPSVKVDVPEGMPREAFRQALVDAQMSIVAKLRGGQKKTFGEGGADYWKEKAGELGELFGMSAPFGQAARVGKYAEGGIKALWKGAPKVAVSIARKGANYATQAFLAYEFGSTVIPPTPDEQLQADQLPPKEREKFLQAMAYRRGIETVAIMPMMAAGNSFIRQVGKTGLGRMMRAAPSYGGATDRSGIVRAMHGAVAHYGGGRNLIDKGMGQVIEGVYQGAKIPGAGELGGLLAQHLPTEEADVLADWYASQGVYGPLERIVTAWQADDDEGVEKAARDYAEAAGVPMVGLGAIHALRGLRVVGALSEKSKVRLFAKMDKELRDSDLPEEAKTAIAEDAYRALNEVTKSAKEDEPRKVAEKLQEATGSPEAARQEVDGRLAADALLPHHEGATPAEKVATINQKLDQVLQADQVDRAEEAALADEYMAAKALGRGDHKRAAELADRAAKIRSGEEPIDATPLDDVKSSKDLAATVDLDRQTRGVEVGKKALEDLAADWETVAVDDGESVATQRDPATGRERRIPLDELRAEERFDAEAEARAAGEGMPAPMEQKVEGAEAPGGQRAGPRPRPHTKGARAPKDLNPELVEQARLVRQQMGPDVSVAALSRALGVGRVTAGKLHAHLRGEAPAEVARPIPTKVPRRQGLQVGGHARTTSSAVEIAGRDMVGTIEAIDGDRVTLRVGRKKVTMQAGDLRPVPKGDLALHESAARKWNRTRAGEKAAQSRKAVKPQSDSLLDAVARLGGLDAAEGKREMSAWEDVKDHAVGIQKVFRKGGKSLERMAEALAEEGFLPRTAEDGGGMNAREAFLERLEAALQGRDAASDRAFEGGGKLDPKRLAEQAREEAERREAPAPTDEDVVEAKQQVEELYDALETLEPGAGLKIIEENDANGSGVEATVQALERAIEERQRAREADPADDPAGNPQPTGADATDAADAVRPSPVEAIPTTPAEVYSAAGEPVASKNLLPKDAPAWEVERLDVVREALDGVVDTRSWEDFRFLHGDRVRGLTDSLKATKEGRELLDRLNRLALKFGRETGGLTLGADLVDFVRRVFTGGGPRRATARTTAYADTVRGRIPVRSGFLHEALDYVRSGVGRLGGFATELVKLQESMKGDVRQARRLLSTLRRTFPQGSTRLEDLKQTLDRLHAGTTKDGDVEFLQSVSQAEIDAATAVRDLLKSVRPLVAHWRKGPMEVRLHIEDLQFREKQEQQALDQAQERVVQAEEMLDSVAGGDKVEIKAAKQELRNAKAQAERAQDRLDSLRERIGSYQDSLQKQIDEFGLDEYWPHVETLASRDSRRLRREKRDAPTDLGQQPLDDGSFRGEYPDWAVQGHAMHRKAEGGLEETGERVRDSLDALFFYLSDVLPTARKNKWLHDHQNALFGTRRLLTEEELRRGYSTNIVFWRPTPTQFARVRNNGAYYRYSIVLGGKEQHFVVKQKMTAEELEKHLVRDDRIFKVLVDPNAKNETKAAMYAEIAAAIEQKPDYVVLLGPERFDGQPTDLFQGQRLGWVDSRPGLTVHPYHAMQTALWVREGGAKQRLENLGRPGRRTWDSMMELWGEVNGQADSLSNLGPIERSLVRLSRGVAGAITTTALGLAAPGPVVNALFGALVFNQGVMGLRAGIHHLPALARTYGRILRLKESFHEWAGKVRGSTETGADNPIWQDVALRDQFLGQKPRNERERIEQLASWHWATSPFYMASARGGPWGDIGLSRMQTPAWVDKYVPQGVRAGSRAMYRRARWFLDEGQWVLWRAAEAASKAHLYVGAFIDAMRAGKSENDARRLAEDATIAAHGTFNSVMKSRLMRTPILGVFGAVTTWMQHAAGTNIRLLVGQRGNSLEVPALNATAGPKKLRDGIAKHAELWVRTLAITQAMGALGITSDDDGDELKPRDLAMDVSGQVGGRLSEFPVVGGAAEEAVQDVSSWMLDQLGITAERFPKTHQHLSWRALEMPIPVVPGGFQGPAVGMANDAIHWIGSMFTGDEGKRDRYAGQLLSKVGGYWLRAYRRGMDTVPVEGEPGRNWTRELGTGRHMEKVRHSGLWRVALDALPGTPIDEAANWISRRSAMRAKDREAARGANWNRDMRALAREMASTQDAGERARIEEEMSAKLGQAAEEHAWSASEARQRLVGILDEQQHEKQGSAVRSIFNMLSQESQVQAFSTALRAGRLNREEAAEVLLRLKGKRRASQWMRQLPPAIVEELERAFAAAEERWDSTSSGKKK